MKPTGICRWLFLVVSLSTWIIETNSKEMRVVCYYTNWSVYRPGAAKFSPQNINPYLCTHLIYAFGGFTKDNTLKPFDKYQDIEKGGYAKFTGLKTYNKNLKTLIAIGGWNEGSSRFSSMVANPDRRKELVKNVIKFLRLNHFDGLDLDWEYPAFRDGGKPRDKDNYANLVQELREEFEREFSKTGRPRLLLTMAVPAGIEYINKGFDVPKLTKYLDWMNILSYDYHSAFEPAVNHHAPLFPLEEDNEYNFDGDLNIDHTIKHYLKLGALPNKLVVGIPTYGRSYTLFNPDAFEIGSPADGPGSMGDATRENGYLAYYEICENVKNQDWEVEQPNPDAMGPIAFKDDQWVGYDDESIVRKKAEYVADNGLGGIMFWAIDNDDFRGTCHGKPYPLIEAGREALLNAYGITEDNLVVPPSKPSKTRSRTKSKLSSRKSQADNENVVEKSSTGSRRRNRINSNISKEEPTEAPVDDSRSRRKTRRKNSREREETSSYSSLKVVTPSYTTPAPPSTPDLDGAFKCEDEGFFAHPKDCKKYFWCLSGAGDSGLVAHQFTCPAGLYFNKAADSCDYTQNVLCNKKLQKATKPTTKDDSSTSSTTPSPTTVSTSRAPPRITAATSKTTFRQTTTTEAYDEDDYEYEDDDEEENKTKLKEEDPRVIKELIDLIKKAGGIEELEKQLRVSKDSSSQTNLFTTQTPISKSLERVLSKTLKKTPTSRQTAYSSLRNSRGPQNEGLRSSEEKVSTKLETTRGKLSYTSISRNRPTTVKSTDDDDEEDGDDIVDDDKKRKTTEKSIEYVNIRRNRTSFTTSEPENKKAFNRNQILGEDDEIEEDEDDKTNSNKKNAYTPQYVNIRRPKPSTTEEPETSKYVQLRRGTTESTQAPTEATDEGTTSKYKTIRRSTTTSTQEPTEETSSSSSSRDETTTSATTATPDSPITVKKYINFFRRGSTTEKPTSDGDDTSSRTSELPALDLEGSTVPSISNETSGSTPGTLNSDSPQQIKNDLINNISSPQETLILSSDNVNVTNISESNFESNSTTQSPVVSTETSVGTKPPEKRPQLFQPRPFLKSTRGTTTPKPIIETTTPKVSQTNLKYRLKTDNSQLEEESVPIKQYKTRGSSRFNSDNSARQDNEKNVGLSPQKRRISTTEKYVEDNRSYRPSELADLSSLTAVDFSKVKDVDFGRTTHRRRRPVTTRTTEESSEANETSSKTPAISRKFASTFGRGRKIIRGSSNQTNSDSEAAPATKKIRGFGSRSTRAPEPSTTERVHSSPKSLSVSPRNRKIIRRFRVTTTTTAAPAQVDDDDVDEDILNERSNLFLRNKDSGFQQNRVEDDNDDDDPSIEEDENIKLSESNIRENSAINSFGSDPKLRGKLAGSGKSYFSGKSVSNEKLSTSPYSFQTSDEEPSERISTEPSIVVRTRKIVRKLPATEATVTSGKEFGPERTFGRKRKIVRKLRPISDLNRIENTRTSDKETTEKSTTLKQTEAPVETTTAKNIPEHLNIPILTKPDADTDDTTENELIDESQTATEKPIASKELTYLETSTAKEAVAPKRLFRPKQYTLRNKNESKSNIPDVSNDSAIIRISNTANTNDTKRIASRGRNKIFRPKIFESRNRFRNSKEESASSERRFSSTPRYNSYSRRTNILKTTKADLPSSVEPDVKTEPGIMSSTEAVEADSTEYERVGSTEPDTEISTVSERVSSTESEILSSTEPERPSSSTESGLSSQVLTVVEEDDDDDNDKYEEFSDDEEDEKSLAGVQEKLYTVPASTESASSKVTQSTTSRYSRFRRPSGRPYFTRSKTTTTTERTEEISPEDNETTLLLSTTPTYTRFVSSSSETTSDSSTSEFTTVDGPTSESVDTVNNTNYEMNNIAEVSTTEFITTMNDLETTLTPEIHTGVNLGITSDAIQTTEGTSTFPDSYDITTSESLETNEIDNRILNDSLSYLDSTTPNGEQDSVETSSDSTEQTETEPTALPDTTQGLETIKETVISTVSSPPTPESSTEHHRTYSLRPVGSRPKFIPPRLKDLSIGHSTESALKAKFSKVYGGTRFRSTTADDSSVKEDEVDAPVSEQSAIVDRPKLASKFSTTERNRFNKYKKGYNSGLRTRERVENPEDRENNQVESSSATTVNRFLYKYSTTKRYDLKFDDDDDDDDEPAEDADDDVDEDEGDFENGEEDESQDSNSKANRPNAPDFFSKPVTRLSNKPSFSKSSTEDSRIEEALKDIDTEAIKNRNKSLFLKKRIMNTPFAGLHSSTSPMTTEAEETTSTDNDIDSQYLSTEVPITEVGKLTESQTTEDPTTIHHVFELSDDPKTTTEALNNKTETTTSRVERLIEVNRITNVETKEEHVKHNVVELKTNGASQIQDKVGEVNRITVIKVVDTDGNVPFSPVYIPANLTTTESAIKSSVDMIIQIAKVQEIPAADMLGKVNLTNISVSLNTSGIPLSSNREGKKFEIFGVGGSKIMNNHVDQFVGKAEIIDGISNINVITPRPAHNPESSTIPLEGLFQTEGPTLFSKNPSISDELLEADHSKFVNVRVLHPDESLRPNKEARNIGKVIPIKILKQDDVEYAMKADVVEIPAESSLDTIRIAPIKVQMSKAIANKLPLIRLGGKSLQPA